MKPVRGALIAVVVLLTIALMADVGMIAFGAFTADAYYLPLRSVPLGDRRREVEDILIREHSRLLRHQRRVWLIVHGAAFGCAVLGLVAACRRDTASVNFTQLR